MEKQAIKRVTIVNRNYPPSNGITGESAAQLARYLISKGVAVDIVTVLNAAYGGGGDSKDNIGEVHGVRTFYNGKGKLLRLLASLVEGYRLIRKAKRLKADWTIVMTDPPLLNFFASKLFRKDTKWMLWSMDIYPDAFSAAGLMKETSALSLYIQSVLKGLPPNTVISLGPVQQAYLAKRYYPNAGTIILPCGIYDKGQQTVPPPDWYEGADKIYIGYCGNIGEAHSVEFVKQVIAQLDASKYTFILSVYGAKAEELKAFVAGKNGVKQVASVSRKHLPLIDIHLATLMDNWVNVCVPSKSVSSVCAGASFLYCGNENSDNWQLLKGAGWLIGNNKDLAEQVHAFFCGVSKESITEKKQNANNIATQLLAMSDKAFADVYDQIKL